MGRLVGLTLFATLAVGVSLVSAQSLGEVARKERERREKNKKQGVEAREFTEDEVFGPDDDDTESENEGDAGVAPIPEIPGERQSSLEGGGDSVSSSDDTDREIRERRRSESQWRSRIQTARARVKSAEEYRSALDGLHLGPGGRYVDANGNTVIHALDHLQRLVREADEELTAAREAVAGIEEEARRAGVPPGWLR